MKFLKKILVLTATPLVQETTSFVFMYILGCICILTMYSQIYMNGLIKMFAELFLDTYILTALITLIPKKARKYIKWTVLCLLYLIAVIDMFCFTRLGNGISSNIIQLIVETNSQESSEFLSSYLTLDILKSSTGIVILLFIVHVAVTNIKKRITPCKPDARLGIGVAVLLAFCCAISLKHKKDVIELFTIDSNKELVRFFTVDISRSRLSYLPVYRLASSIHMNSIERAQTSLYLQAYNHIAIDSCDVVSPHIVLIIGESYNKHHSALFGYQKPTTPFQSQEAASGRLFAFQDAVTPNNLTSEVFKNILSLNDCSSKEQWHEMPLFTQILKHAGYNISFISNQFQAKDYNDFSAGAFIDNIQISKLQFCHRNNRLHEYDMGLLQEYDSLKAYNTDKNLTIFHFIGQHIDYKNRFPQEYKYFSDADYHRPDLSKKEVGIIADYDNATRYNDEVLRQIIMTFESTNTIILFLSDHGEECYDEIHTFGRQHNQKINRFIAKNEFEIPFWIWCSDEYQEKHPDIAAAIKTSASLPFYSSDLGHLILSIAGVHCKYYRQERNILNPAYEKHKRIIKEMADYDVIINQGK